MHAVVRAVARTRELRCAVLLCAALAIAAAAQAPAAPWGPALQWRAIGPFRGGRVVAVAGLAHAPQVYYLGATGGGVWKTADAGIRWTNVSDRYFQRGSIGAIAVAASNPAVVYVGTGEACLRTNLSEGDGIYKSLDAGRTWRNIGLRDSSQIGALVVSPTNADVVYVAALGHPYGPNAERGVFRSRDGGRTWKRVLFVNDRTGAVDLVMDPSNARVLYASFWQVIRKPWGIYPTGPGSGIYKSTDGGDTWTKLTAGLPTGNLGKIGLTVSPVDPRTVWATIGGAGHGIYRSDDGGEHWRLLNNAFWLTSRQYYYGHIFADPQKLGTLYLFCAKSFLKSVDGGNSWRPMPNTTHGDYHALWIDPHDDQRWINGNDGGAAITFDGGRSYSTEENQPTGQFYTVSTDTAYPFRVYGSQQDDTTVSILSRAPGGIGATDWNPVGGGESGYVTPDPADPNLVYASAFWGRLTLYDRRTGAVRDISPWPDMPGGRKGPDTKYRFQWTFPIAISPAAPNSVYVGGNVVFKSTDQGQDWQVISPDLTRHDPVRDSHGVLNDVYGTVFTIAPSPRDAQVLWTGSDDGLVYLTQNGGQSWANVTPPAIAPWTRINMIEAGPFDPATAYVVATRYQLDDFRPYIYRTHDFGKTWTAITTGIAPAAFARSLRADPARRGLLFAATEAGVYVSFDDGDQWQSLQLNLPQVPVTDLALRRHDLVISTQGRGFWILDDITPLEQFDAGDAVRLFAPRPTVRWPRGGFFFGAGATGQNPPSGVLVNYFLPQAPASPVTLQFLDSSDQVIRTFSSAAGPRGEAAPTAGRFRRFAGPYGAVTAHAGLNRFAWDMRYPGARGLQGTPTYLMGGGLAGPQAPPGTYRVRLTVEGQTQTQSFAIRGDPNLPTTPEQYRQQFRLLLAVRDRLSAANDAISRVRALRRQLAATLQAAGDRPVAASVKRFDGRLAPLLDDLWQSHYTGFDDQTLVYPLRLNNRIAALEGYLAGDFPPTDQDAAVFAELSAQLRRDTAALHRLVAEHLPALNAQLRAQGLAVIASPFPNPKAPPADTGRH